MPKVDPRLEILEQARNIVRGDGKISSSEQGELLKMIDIMAAAVRDYAAPSDHTPHGEDGKISTRHALLSLLKQQADELDALKKLSLNLTSSLNYTAIKAKALDQLKTPYKAFHSRILWDTTGVIPL